RRFSGLRKEMPVTHWTFLCGAISLSALPLTSGFWSKEEILDACYQASERGGTYGKLSMLLPGSAIATGFLAAVYTFRAYFKTFHGPLKLPDETHGHAHESPRVMTIPLIVLAVPAVLIGLALGPTHQFSHFLEKTSWFPHGEEAHINWALMGIGTAV